MTSLLEKQNSNSGQNKKMWALEYQGPGKRALVEKEKPIVKDSTDAVVKMLRTTICGTDLHILKGDVPTVTSGRILGHEGIGVIDSIGQAVTAFKVGDRVLISCVTADGRCEYCKQAMYSHCVNGGWILGNTIDGTQAEFVRIPFADTSLYAIPKGASDDSMVLLSDILPTGFECGVLKGKVKLGDTVAIVGAGPIGLAALLTAQFFSPAEVIMIDTNEDRLKRATEFGATHTINSENGQAVAKVLELTKNRGVNVAIEAVGLAATFNICQSILTPGGHLANIGVHGKPVELQLEKLWDRNVTITTRLVDTETIPILLKSVTSGKINPEKLVTHRFNFKDVMKAYDTFSNASKEQALKVMISME